MDNALRFFRKKEGLTLQQLADRAATSKSYIWELENSRHIPGLHVAYSIAAVLGVKTSDIWPENFNNTQRSVGKKQLSAVGEL